MKKITARYTSKCSECDRTIKRGSPVLWEPGAGVRRGGKPGGEPLDAGTQHVELLEVSDIKRGDPDAGIRRALDEAFVLESHERLANRATTRAEAQSESGSLNL